MEKLQQKISTFYNKYFSYIILAFGILTLLPYVKTFSMLGTSSISGIIYRGVVFGFVILFFLTAFFSYKKLPNKKILLPCLIYVVTQIITIFVSSIIKGIEIPALESIIGVGMIFSNIICIFIVCYIFDNQNLDREKLNIISYVFLGVSVALCLYTYIFQYKEIAMSFKGECGISSPVTSIFTTNEMYGFILLISTISTVILALNSKKYFLYAFPGFFLLNAFISKSRLALTGIFIILIAALIHHLIHNYKGNEKKWEISLFIGFAILLIFNLIIFIPTISFEPFATLRKYITSDLIDNGMSLAKDRLSNASNLIKSLDYPLGIMFGAGERIYGLILPINSNGNIIYVTNFAAGGLVKFVLYLIFIVFMIYAIIKRKREHLFFSLLFIILIVLIGVFSEATVLGINAYFLLSVPFIILNASN